MGDADVLSPLPRKKSKLLRFPFAAHATMEPMNCAVHIRPDAAEA